MKIKRIGHRYTDSESGVTLDCWFPRDNKKKRAKLLVQESWADSKRLR